jgi:hypothetical protein
MSQEKGNRRTTGARSVRLAVFLFFMLFLFAASRFMNPPLTIDLSPPEPGSPEALMETYYRAIREKHWADAAACLSTEYRKAFRGPIEDRRFFDCYSPHGFKTKATGFIMRGWVGVRKSDDKAAVIEIGNTRPYESVDDSRSPGLASATSFRTLVKESGAWRISFPWDPRPEYGVVRRDVADFEHYYNASIPEEARGWAKRVEAHGTERQ